MIPNTDHPADDRPALSVVIVAYNEEAYIRECIESVVTASRDLVDFEILLVDSNSTDMTVDIASEYPITILRITNDELTTPGAGRYVGMQAASGELLLFVDGDMVLQRPWLERAIMLLRAENRTVAVDGHLNGPARRNDVIDVDAVRGAALYDGDPLRSIGGFDPYLKSLADVHLGYQLIEAGYRLRRLPEMAASHPTDQSLMEPLRQWRHGYMLGAGQALRKSVGSIDLFRKHLSRVRYRIGLFAWLCLGLVVLVSPTLFAGWVSLSGIGGGYLISQHGLEESVTGLLSKLLGIAGLFGGFVLTPKPSAEFPLTTVETLQLGTIQHERPPEIVE